MKKIAICYFSYAQDIDFLNQSLKSIKHVIDSDKHIDARVYVFDDGRYKKQIKKKELSIPCTLITTNFNRNGNLNGFECINGMFTEYTKILKKFEYDYLIKLDSDCVLNSFDYIHSVENVLRKQNRFDSLAQIGSYFAKLCCYGCCQTFTKLGISTIMNLCNHMSAGVSKQAQVMKKRVENGWNQDKVVSILMEMSPVLRVATESILGVKGHLNAFLSPDQNYSQYMSVAFKPNKYGKITWTREQSLEKMKEHVNNYISSVKKVSSLHDYVKNKTVAVVGNADVEKDYSQQIDSADIVIRINNFYNYQSGKVGKKVDAVVTSGFAACQKVAPKGHTQDEILFSKKPKIYIVSETFNQDLKSYIQPRFRECQVEMLPNDAHDLQYTTGTILLKLLSQMDDVKVSVYGFDVDDKWSQYLRGFAVHHLNSCGMTKQNELRQKLLNSFKNK